MADSAAATPGDHLDAEERQLLMLLASGQSAAEAADNLGVTVAVVAHRLQCIRVRLAVRSTAEAIKVVLGRHRD